MTAGASARRPLDRRPAPKKWDRALPSARGASIAAALFLGACGGEAEAPEAAAGPGRPLVAEAPVAPLTLPDILTAAYRGSDRALDARQAPEETLAAIGFRSDWRLGEIWPGAGYWPRLLSPLLAEGGGAFIAAHLDPGAGDAGLTRARAAFLARMDALPPAAREAIFITSFSGAGEAIAAPASLDAVILFDGFEALAAGGLAPSAAQAAFAALRPGGAAFIRGADRDDARLSAAMDAFEHAGFAVAPLRMGGKPGFRAVKE